MNNTDKNTMKLIEAEPVLKLLWELDSKLQKINEAKNMFQQFRDSMYVDIVDRETKAATAAVNTFLASIDKGEK